MAISIPLNSTAEFQANANKPSPLTVEQYTQAWCDAIHKAGMGVIFRGTFCECEGIYNFALHKDTAAYWEAKAVAYITNNPTFFASGDIFAPFPESTNIFAGKPFGDIYVLMPNGTSDYANFFIGLNKATQAAFLKINKAVKTGMSTNNYTEINSGWIPQALFDDAKAIVVDTYGTPAVIDTELRSIYAARGKYPIFHQEWGLDYVATNPTTEMQAFLDGTQKRVTDGIQNALNYWGGWTGTPEAIFVIDTEGNYQLNGLGQQLQAFYGETVVVTPVPPVVTTPPATTTFVLPKGTYKSTLTLVSDGAGGLTFQLTPNTK